MRLQVALLTLAVTLAGCAHNVTGAAVPNPAAGGTGLRAADAERVLLGAEVVSQIVGRELQIDADRSQPIAGSSAAPVCSALDAVGMAAFVGDTWSNFRVVLLTDGARHRQVVAEAVAVYPDAAAAASVFAAAAGAARSCDGQRALGTGGDAAWSFTVPAADAAAVRWRKEQIGIPLDWVCHGEARLRINAVLQVMVCGGDESGRDVSVGLADRMSAAVWELSGR